MEEVHEGCQGIERCGCQQSHHLVLCKLQLKQNRTKKNSEKDPTVKTKFVLELTNRFQVLEDDNVQKTFLDTSKDVLGYRKREQKE